ncbi:MAG: sulfotransferase [bacterium]
MKVTFIMGVAHSGTTILHRLMGRHPDAAWFSQFSQRGGTIPGRTRFPFWGLYNRLARSIFGVPWKKQRGFTEYVIPRPMEANEIWNHLLPPEEQTDITRTNRFHGYEDRPDLRERIYEVIRLELRSWNRDHLLVKLPRLTEYTLLLARNIPDAQFIHLIRDGRAVALSNLHKFEREYSGTEALKESAGHWKDVVEWMDTEVRDQVERERFYQLGLEEFQSSPRELFEELLSFSGLSTINYPWPMPEIREDTNKKWRNRATREQISSLEETLGEALEQTGYDSTW